jgi:4-hydroxythreonine-4-phosphate dehydrogenase
MTPWIGITLGDVTGIGPEVTLKALASESNNGARYVLIGDQKQIESLNDRLGLKLQFQSFLPPGQGHTPGTEFAPKSGDFLIYQPLPESLPLDLTPGSPQAARAAVAWLEAGAKLCVRHELDALVTSPVNKESILRTGKPFIGQTELLSELAGTARTAMMLLGNDSDGHFLRVALVTTHLPLRLVADHLDQAKIEKVIELAAQACYDLQLPQARIGVCGLNPHAGEGGEMGDEEIRVIGPAVQAARQRELDVTGPISADSLFYSAYHGRYDAVVAMYHDQGLVPLKMIGFDTGVNWTLGLPFIRTSPDHGTAYDIAQKGIANCASMTSAIQLAKRLIAKRA